MTYVEGQQVWLKPFDNGERLIGREHGVITGVTELPWGTSIVVAIDVEYRDGADDDGLREITVDQIESAGPQPEPQPEPPPYTGETIGDLVRRALSNARDNGYTFDDWTDEQVAQDLITHDADLEDACLKTITIVVREVRT
jgi:hypothetical protein